MKLGHWVSALRQHLSARIPVRRSTALLTVLFVGLGVLWLNVKTNPTGSSTSAGTANTVPPGYVIYPAPRATTTTVSSSTTATAPPTTAAPPPGTAPGTTSTTTAVQSPGPQTTVTSATTATTTAPGASRPAPTSSSVPGG